MVMPVLVRVICVALAIIVTACGGGSQPQPESSTPSTTPAPAPAAPIGASTISGTVKLEGTPPEARVIRMASDPLCMPEGPTVSEVVLVGPDNGLQNVFVYVKDGLGDRTFTAPQTPVVLDQRGCKYRPHVFGAQVGQPLKIVNSDGTLHNVHAVPKVNNEFNFGQPLKGMESTQTFTKSEIMVPFRCDVHGWMAAYGGIVPHPFFAVTEPDGSFEIKGLPAGTYTIETWHERFGLQTQTVTVDGTAPGMAAFSYKAS
jgi:plastocyanin